MITKRKLYYGVLAAALVIPLISPLPARAQVSVIRNIVFPVVGQVHYSDDFGAPRSGHTHMGNDLMGKKMMPLVAAVDGTISSVIYPEATWGYEVNIRDADGYQYWYLHVNNDNPGTDDGQGGGFFAYAPDVQPGNPVVKGQLIGWMGDSGDAESTSPHLHFEIHAPTGEAFDPYQSLQAATHINAPIAEYPVLAGEILPYSNFAGGTSIASANFDSDNAPEIVTGAGAGGGPHVRIFKKDGSVKTEFFAYDPSFHGGIDVAAADVDGDGAAEIITAPGPGGGPHIRIFKTDGTLYKEFFAYDANFQGGAHVTAADIDGDGKAEIITGPDASGGPDVRVFKPDGQMIKEFMAYDPNFHGGIDVASLPKTASQNSAIITAPGAGGGPHIKIFDAAGILTKDFMAYDPNFHGGVRVSAQSSAAQTPTITTMPASGGGPHLKTFSLDGTEIFSNLAAFEPWWRGGYDVTATSDGTVYIASVGGRRTSLRTSTFNSSRGGFGPGPGFGQRGN